VSLAFLTVGADPASGALARSPMEEPARRAGARLRAHDGWVVAAAYSDDPRDEAAAARRTVGWADVSHLAKLELQGAPAALDGLAAETGVALSLTAAGRAGGAWWCRLTPTRALVIGPADVPSAAGVGVVDVTSGYGAMTVLGPAAREVFARFCALDLRPDRTPIGALRPGSIARQPGVLVREADERYLFLFGAAYGEYIWETVADAAAHLGGRAIGLDALAGWPVDEEA
jgi:heterotetrameric sarcosine oxidase gamma subunit